MKFFLFAVVVVLSGASTGTGSCIDTIDVGIILDASASIGKEFSKGKAAMIELVKMMNVGTNHTRVACLQFSTDAKADFMFNTYNTNEQVEVALRDLKDVPTDSGNTGIDMAFKLSADEVFITDHGSRVDAKRLVIVVTDGAFPQDLPVFWRMTEPLRDQDISVLDYGLGSTANHMNDLVALAENDPQNVFQEGQTNELYSRIQSLVTTFCERKR